MDFCEQVHVVQGAKNDSAADRKLAAYDKASARMRDRQWWSDMLAD